MNTQCIKSYVVSNIGNVCSNHEDNFFIPSDNYINSSSQKSIKLCSNSICYDYCGNNGIFVVCDGMGGHNAGEVASRIAVETVLCKYNDILKSDKNGLLAFIKELNNEICEQSTKDPRYANMGSTFSGLIIYGDNVSILHIGDSRIYKIENNKLFQLSKDHTEGCRLVEAGILKHEDLPNFPNRKLLYKYLGRKGDLVADCENINVLNKSMFIIASDGLTDTLSISEIMQSVFSLEKPKEICNSLLKKCLNKGQICRDNVTIMCIDIEKTYK